MRFRTLLGLGLLSVSSALTSPALAAPDYSAILINGAEGPIVSGYRQFHASAKNLESGIQTMCAAPDAAGLEKVKADFHAAMDAWQRVQWIGYGPVEAFHRGQRVQFWPDKKNAGDRQMLSLIKDRKGDALSPHRIAFASVAIQGLPALEMLLFSDGQAEKLLAGGEETAFRCQLVDGIANNIVRIAEELVQEWEKPEGFINTLKTIGSGSNPYADQRQAASQMFNALHGELSAIAEIKLSYPLGASAAEARPGRSENWRSKRSIRNIDIDLEALRAVFVASITPVLAASGKSAASDRFLAAVDDARASLAKVDLPMEDAMTTPDGWNRLNAAKGKVKAIAQVMETDIANALELQVGFNALDGD